MSLAVTQWDTGHIWAEEYKIYWKGLTELSLYLTLIGQLYLKRLFFG